MAAVEAFITHATGICLSVTSAAAESATVWATTSAFLIGWGNDALGDVTDVMVTAASACPIAILLVHVASFAMQLTFSTVDWGSASLHRYDCVLMAYIVVRAMDAVLGAIALEHFASTPSYFALGARHRFPPAANGRLQPVDRLMVSTRDAAAMSIALHALAVLAERPALSANRLDVGMTGAVMRTEAASAVAISLEDVAILSLELAFRTFYGRPSIRRWW